MITKLLKVTTTDCPQCKSLEKELITFTKIPVFSVNADEDESVVEKYNLSSVPTILFFNEVEEVIFKHIGFITKTQLEDKIDELNSF